MTINREYLAIVNGGDYDELTMSMPTVGSLDELPSDRKLKIAVFFNSKRPQSVITLHRRVSRNPVITEGLISELTDIVSASPAGQFAVTAEVLREFLSLNIGYGITCQVDCIN